MLEVLDWQRVAEPRAVVRRTTAMLLAGQTIAYPTESSYALTASGLAPSAVERIRMTGDGQARPLSVAVRA
jgi:tRNA A37 threonylcarbamoyladenosine synthetase subunit TsaC/SUA5/YrdC